MSWMLYRLGRWSFRHRWTVLISWLIVLSGAGVGAAALAGSTADDFAIPGMESTEAFDIIKERTPEASPDGATARIVLQAPEGEPLAEYIESVDGILASVSTESVVSILGPFESGAISEDGRTGFAEVIYEGFSTELTEEDLAALEGVSELAESAGLTGAVGGDALQTIPALGAAEIIGVAVALVVLVFTLGTLMAAGMPLLTALVGVGVGVLGITIATGFMNLGSTTPILATMLGLAVGIDYALFIVSRYRHEIGVGRSAEEAAGRAVGTAGSAVVFAGMTVIIALVGLSIVQISMLTQMGIAAGATVAVAVLVALTLLPALFGFAGRRILKSRLPFLRNNDPEAHDRVTMGRKWVTFVVKNRVAVLIVGLVIAGVTAVPVASMQLALPDQGSDPEGSETRIAYELISDNFGEGANGPLVVLIDTAETDDPLAAVTEVNEILMGLQDNVLAAIPAGPHDPGEPGGLEAFVAQLEATQYALATVIPETGPASVETQDLVADIREAVAGVNGDTGARVLVSGQTAVGIDISQELADAFPSYLLVVVGLAFVLLVMVFRSILVPVKAVVGFLVTILVALGVTIAIAQWGWGASLVGFDSPGPIMSMLPLLMTGILFGLAMDYELFLVSRMREEYAHGNPAQESIVVGFQHGARVVTAAALIMTSVFGSFAFMDDPIIKTIGLALAIGILADAFLVRMTLVPAVMSLVGDKMWWLPKWLDRILPDLDIEGEKLTQRLDQKEAVTTE